MLELRFECQMELVAPLQGLQPLTSPGISLTRCSIETTSNARHYFVLRRHRSTTTHLTEGQIVASLIVSV